MRLSPVSALTVADLPSTIVAAPRIVRTFAFLSSAPTPPVSLATIESFQAIVLAKSSSGGPIERPIAFSACGSRNPCAASAAWISAFEGIQPTLRQVPPTRSASTRIVSRPSWPARIAAT